MRTSLKGRLDDLELIATELATNASLHTAGTVIVELNVDQGRARLAVKDESLASPINAARGLDSMTGRGLMLVEALSDRWGVERREAGKAVWAEVGRHEPTAIPSSPHHDPSLDIIPPATLREGSSVFSGEPHYRIELGEVPTDLLIAAKTHLDNLLREFTLATRGAASGVTAAIPTHLASLIERVAGNFVEARTAIKLQALAARAAGEPRTEIVLDLPLSAIDTGRDYLNALDEVDNYARAARLLTVETPPQHRAFRHWYTTQLIEQLDAHRRHTQPPPPRRFDQFLLDEFGIVAAAHRATDRAARLQRVTSSLAAATTVEDVANTVVSHAVEALGATAGALLTPDGIGGLDVVSSVHYSETLKERLSDAGLDARLPAATTLRVGTASWLESPEQIRQLFPDLHHLEPDTVSMCAVPVALAGKVLGALRLSFDAPRLFDKDERSFFMAFAAQAAQALARSNLYAAEQRARTRAEDTARQLRRINRVAAALARSNDVTEICRIVTVETHQALGAAVTALCLLEDNATLRVVEIHGATQQTRAQWKTFPLGANLPASETVRLNQPIIIDSRADLEAQYPDLAGQAPHDYSVVCVPLSTEEGPLGALSVSFHPEAVDGGLIETLATLASQCAIALDRALLSAQKSRRPADEPHRGRDMSR